MPTYTAEFHTNAERAMFEIEASTPHEALTKAYAVEPSTLDFQPYDDWQPIDYITIRDADGNDLAEWQSEQLRLEKAIPDIIAIAQQILGLWDDDISLPHKMMNDLKAAIAKAKGGVHEPHQADRFIGARRTAASNLLAISYSTRATLQRSVSCATNTNRPTSWPRVIRRVLLCPLPM